MYENFIEKYVENLVKVDVVFRIIIQEVCVTKFIGSM